MNRLLVLKNYARNSKFLFPILTDGCPRQGNVPLYSGSDLTLSWPETEIYMSAMVPCPCQELTQQYGSMASRACGGSYTFGGVWGPVDGSACQLESDVVRQLCEATMVSQLTTPDY